MSDYRVVDLVYQGIVKEETVTINMYGTVVDKKKPKIEHSIYVIVDDPIKEIEYYVEVRIDEFGVIRVAFIKDLTHDIYLNSDDPVFLYLVKFIDSISDRLLIYTVLTGRDTDQYLLSLVSSR